MYVVWLHMCLLCLHITFGTLSIYVCTFRVCSVEGVRGKASEMTVRRLFSRNIPLGLKLPPFLARRVNDKSLQPRPFQKTLFTSNVSPSCTIPQPPLMQPSKYQVPCQLSIPRYSVTTAAASLGIEVVFV